MKRSVDVWSRPLRAGALAAVVAFGASCGGSDGEAHPGQLFSGFEEGAGDFKVPVTLAGIEDSVTVRWSVDSSMASIATEQPEAGKRATALNTHHAIITTKKPGKTTVKAEADGETYEIPLTITKYAPGSRQLGNELYQIDRTGSNPEPGSAPSDVKGLGCIACHGTKGGPGHSPAEIGGYDDAAILRTIATAQRPGGGLANKGEHKFNLDDKQKEAILARLRSLEPSKFPD